MLKRIFTVCKYPLKYDMMVAGTFGKNIIRRKVMKNKSFKWLRSLFLAIVPVSYTHLIPDQIEAGTVMCAAAATRGDIMVKNVIPKHCLLYTARCV